FDVEPARVLDFSAVDLNFSARIVGEKRNHERMRERPGLAGEVAHLAHADSNFLIHLSLQTLLQGFPRFDETRQGAVDALRKTRRAREQQLSFSPHQPHHRWREPGIRYQPALRALAAALARAGCGRRTASSAVLMRPIPLD